MNLKKGYLETPFDVVNLPSMGVFYPNKKSSLFIKYLTTRDEIVLTSPSIIENNQAIDIIIENSILDTDVNYHKLLACDKKAIMMFLRSTTYGDKLELNVNCPKCSSNSKSDFYLSSLEMKDDIKSPDKNLEYEFMMPKMKFKGENVVIKFKPLTVESENSLLQESKSTEKNGINNYSTLRLKYTITKVNENDDKVFIENIIKIMPLGETATLKKFIDQIEPGFEKNIKLNCSICNDVFLEKFNIGNEILTLSSEHRKNVMEETFLGYYYGKGLTREDMYKMSVSERRWTIQRISEEVEKKNKAEQDAVNKSKRK